MASLKLPATATRISSPLDGTRMSTAAAISMQNSGGLLGRGLLL